MVSESSSTPKTPSILFGKMSPTQSDDWSRASDRDMEREILFTPKGSLPLISRSKPISQMTETQVLRKI